MSNVWVKICLQSAYAAVLLFFAMLFLSFQGITIFAEQFFSQSGFAVLLLFAIFNVFVLLHW